MKLASTTASYACRLLALAGLVAFALVPLTGQTEVVFVDYDMATAKVHGDLPSRAQMAQLLTALHGAGAKAVILKFFLDGPGKEPDNTQLTDAIGKGRTLLQATINKAPPTSRDLPARFRHAGKPPFTTAIRGDEGWLPLNRFSEKAARVCFADVRSPEQVPMLEEFGGHPVPSLYACLLAELTGKEMVLTPGAASFGAWRLPLNAQGEANLDLNASATGARVSATRIFAGSDWRPLVRNKVAVLMYTGPRSPTVVFRDRQEKVHDLFAAQIVALQRSMSRN